MNLGQMLVNTARRFPERAAVTWGAHTLSYRELDLRSDGLARGLDRIGVGRGDRVALLMRNRPELVETMFACFKAGYCIVPLNARFTRDEVDYHVADSGATVLITDADVGADSIVVEVGPEYEALTSTSGGSTVAPIDRDDLAWLFYTSGTTGRPKGAMLTHGSLAFVTSSWLADLTPMTELDVTLHAAPLSHGAGFHCLAAVARGAHQVIPLTARFDPVETLDLMRSARVTNTWLVPTQIIMLTDSASGPLPDLRTIVYGGAPFPSPELQRAVDTFGPVFVQLFGQGETPMTATFLPAREHHGGRLASAGVPRPGMDVRVLDALDHEVPFGEVGEVCVRGPAVMLGYWKRDDATAETLRNGWLHTGDLGRMDEFGYIYLLDRAKDMIITGGSNVYAVEVEAVVAGVAGVREVAVIGVPDRTWGELVVAVVAGDPELEQPLSLACRAHLAGYKQPRRFEFVDALPRNTYGKVLKRDLRARFS